MVYEDEDNGGRLSYMEIDYCLTDEWADTCEGYSTDRWEPYYFKDGGVAQ